MNTNEEIIFRSFRTKRIHEQQIRMKNFFELFTQNHVPFHDLHLLPFSQIVRYHSIGMKPLEPTTLLSFPRLSSFSRSLRVDSKFRDKIRRDIVCREGRTSKSGRHNVRRERERRREMEGGRGDKLDYDPRWLKPKFLR